MSLESSRHISDSKRLLAVAGEGIGDRLGSVANGVRRLLGNALALVTAGAGSVTDLLACALLALRLDGSGNAVASARQALAGLLGGRLLGVGGDLLGDLVTESLAKSVRHIEYWLGGGWLVG